MVDAGVCWTARKLLEGLGLDQSAATEPPPPRIANITKRSGVGKANAASRFFHSWLVTSITGWGPKSIAQREPGEAMWGGWAYGRSRNIFLMVKACHLLTCLWVSSSPVMQLGCESSKVGDVSRGTGSGIGSAVHCGIFLYHNGWHWGGGYDNSGAYGQWVAPSAQLMQVPCGEELTAEVLR